MAFIVQQSHPGLRQASNLELTFIQMLQITDPQIQLITADAIDNLLRGHRQQAELQRRIFLRQGFNQLHRIEARQRHHTDPQLADHLPATDGRLCRQAVMGSQHRPRPGQDPLSLRGKTFKTLAALDQRQVQLLFQVTNAHGERRLGNMTGRRRLAKMARLIERDQILELLNIHSLSRLNPAVHPRGRAQVTRMLVSLAINSSEDTTRCCGAQDGAMPLCAIPF